MPLYVSSTIVLIIRRSKLYYTASGIITPVGGRLVHRLKEDSSLSHLHTHYSSPVPLIPVPPIPGFVRDLW